MLSSPVWLTGIRLSVQPRNLKQWGLKNNHGEGIVNFAPLRMWTADRTKFYSRLIALCTVLVAGVPLYGQSDLNAPIQGASSGADYTSGPRPQSPYLGAVPNGTASPTALSLSLQHAVARGLGQNLGGLLSADAVSGARGERWQALSALLPNLTTSTSFGVRQTDLKATIGIDVPGHPPIIGPFGVFDTRAYLDQSLFNWESIERSRSSAAQVKSAQYSYKNARELIVAVVVSNYLLVIADPQRVASTRARALSAVADERQKQAELAQAELNLGYTRVLAPVTGEVTKKVVVGLNVDPGEEMLTVVPLDQIWITANFKETQLKNMRPGQRVKVTCDSNDRSYKGHVDSIAGATGPLFSLLPPENATGNYVKIVQRIPAKIVLEPGENRDHQLRPGMNVEAKVYLR